MGTPPRLPFQQIHSHNYDLFNLKPIYLWLLGFAAKEGTLLRTILPLHSHVPFGRLEYNKQGLPALVNSQKRLQAGSP